MEQGFRLLRIEIAQSRAQCLLHDLPVGVEKLQLRGAVLDLGQGVVALLLRDHELPAIRERVLLMVVMERSKGVARLEEKTASRLQMRPHARQHRFVIFPRQQELEGVHQHKDERKLLLNVERARVCDDPFNRDRAFRRFPARMSDHLRHDVHPCDRVAQQRQVYRHAPGAAGEIKQRASERPCPLLHERVICVEAVAHQIVGQRISKFLK